MGIIHNSSFTAQFLISFEFVLSVSGLFPSLGTTLKKQSLFNPYDTSKKQDRILILTC
jgi:hypothetical protein